MHCPICQHETTEVKDSRPLESGDVIRRRRVCPGCGHRFTTHEKLVVRGAGGNKRPTWRRLRQVLEVALRMIQRMESDDELKRGFDVD